MKIKCKKCGTVFTVSREYWERAGEQRASVFCPNGHSFTPPKLAGRFPDFDRVKQMLFDFTKWPK